MMYSGTFQLWSALGVDKSDLINEVIVLVGVISYTLQCAGSGLGWP